MGGSLFRVFVGTDELESGNRKSVSELVARFESIMEIQSVFDQKEQGQ